MQMSLWNPSSIRHRLHALVRKCSVDASGVAGRTLPQLPVQRDAIISVATKPMFSGAGERIASQPRPVRVVRVLDAGPARANTGRMVISGRIADVCAELDRLVANEALVH